MGSLCKERRKNDRTRNRFERNYKRQEQLARFVSSGMVLKSKPKKCIIMIIIRIMIQIWDTKKLNFTILSS